jgi:hypothetical protein
MRHTHVVVRRVSGDRSAERVNIRRGLATLLVNVSELREQLWLEVAQRCAWPTGLSA